MQANNQSVTHENAANEVLQNDSNILQTILQMPPLALLWGVSLGLAATGFANLGPCIVLGIIGTIYLVLVQNKVKLDRAKARAAAYSMCCGPIMVMSCTPEEGPAEISARAEKWRENLKLSGNPYWNVLPIVEFPYSPVLYESGQLSASWNMYLAQADARRHVENIKWLEGKCPQALKSIFAMQVMPAPKEESND